MAREFPFRLRLPVFAAPMFLVSGQELVVAACEAGIVGCFPASNCRTPEELDDWMGSISARLERARSSEPGKIIGPWAANLNTHSTNARLPDVLKLIARHKPPIVITALGSPRPAIEVVHGYGGYVIADVPNLTLARKAVAAGADGLACIAAGAGGHTGHLSPFAFVSAVREFFEGWVIIGGGIADGEGVAGAIAMGADFVYVGTRFLASAQSIAPAGHKQMVVDCGIDDLVVSAALTGAQASWLKPSLAACDIDLAQLGAKDYSGQRKRWRDTWTAGQGLHQIKAIESLGDIVDNFERGYRRSVQRMARLADVP